MEVQAYAKFLLFKMIQDFAELSIEHHHAENRWKFHSFAKNAIYLRTLKSKLYFYKE
jgi:hypothetical protein